MSFNSITLYYKLSVFFSPSNFKFSALLHFGFVCPQISPTLSWQHSSGHTVAFFSFTALRLPISPTPPRPFVYQLIIFFCPSLIFKFSYLLHFMFVCPQISPTLRYFGNIPLGTPSRFPLYLSLSLGMLRAVFARWCGPSSPDRLPGTCFSFVPPCAGTNATTRSSLCCHQKPTFQSFICRLLHFLAGQPIYWPVHLRGF